MVGESYPPDLWQAGDIVRDTYRLRALEDGPAIYSLGINARMGGHAQDETATTSLAFKLAPAPPVRALSRPASCTLGGKIELAGYLMPDDPSLVPRGFPLTRNSAFLANFTNQ